MASTSCDKQVLDRLLGGDLGICGFCTDISEKANLSTA